MKIEVLYVPDCPHVPATLAQLREVLFEEGAAAEVHEVLVRDLATAEALHFRGSPTIRVDGRDLFQDSSSPGVPALTCRLYSSAEEKEIAFAEKIRRAVREARQQEHS